MLCIDLRSDGDADAAEFIARRVEHLAAPVEQAAERSAGHDARQVHGARARAHGQQCSLRIERVNGRGDLRGLDAEHQRLAIADEYIECRIAFGDDGNAHLARQLVDERIALVEQVVGRLAALMERGRNFAVEPGDSLRERGDFLRFDAERGR